MKRLALLVALSADRGPSIGGRLSSADCPSSAWRLLGTFR